MMNFLKFEFIPNLKPEILPRSELHHIFISILAFLLYFVFFITYNIDFQVQE